MAVLVEVGGNVAVEVGGIKVFVWVGKGVCVSVDEAKTKVEVLVGVGDEPTNS